MKKISVILSLIFICLYPTKQASSQIPVVSVIKAGVKKAIKAIDLKIQRLQNKTIWLQNAQKVLENKMSSLKLGEIGDWVTRQKELYANYFEELQRVKTAVATFHMVKEILDRQIVLVKEYSKSYALSRQDKNFTPEELNYMQQVYSGILEESFKNVEELQLVITAFTTQMTDAQRMKIIQSVADNTETNLGDLRQFNQENIKISLQRSKDQHDIDIVRKLYGIR